MRPYSNDLRLRVLYACEERTETYEEIGERFMVSQAWVSQIARNYRKTGSLFPRKQTGRPKRLKDVQIERLRQLLNYGATAHGWINELWTIQRVRELIRREFGIQFSITGAWRILRLDLGWTSQKPTTRLRERNEEKIRQWRCETFGRIVRAAKDRGASIAFADEAGFMLLPTLRKTFAPKGSRPFTKVSDPHGRISAACAITLSPKRSTPNLFFRLHRDNANFTGEMIARFLQHICSQLQSPLTMIWDSIPIHSAEPVRKLLRRNRDLVLEMIPEYAPELNPADGVWSYVKYGRLGNFAPYNLTELRKRVAFELRRVKRRPDLLRSFIRKSNLAVEP
jgi:transposase